ncbi:MAG TPA: amidohydrolase family protein [Acidobacteriota bacterium]|nr:amidohydrolase family protein [Acidobacteriota bacterium]
MRVIDFHNHFYPPEYIEAIRDGPSNVKVTVDSDHNPLLHYPGDYNILVPAHRDIDFRANVLEAAGIDKQILTFTTPGVHIESPARSVKLARIVNDRYAEIMRRRSNRFSALATLPLNDPAASVAELDRVSNGLGFRGAMLFSNVNGVALSDPRFWPLYEKADGFRTVFFIHPTTPVGVEAMTEYWLMPLIGFPYDTTLAAAKLVFSGVIEKFPGITWVLAHLGGAIPYLAERLDRGYFAFSECRQNISRPPSEYLKRIYLDTVNFDSGALRLAIDFAGADHLVAGSDYPHQIGSLEKMVASIKDLGISQKEKQDILGENAARLLGL